MKKKLLKNILFSAITAVLMLATFVGVFAAYEIILPFVPFTDDQHTEETNETAPAPQFEGADIDSVYNLKSLAVAKATEIKQVPCLYNAEEMTFIGAEENTVYYKVCVYYEYGGNQYEEYIVKIAYWGELMVQNGEKCAYGTTEIVCTKVVG